MAVGQFCLIMIEAVPNPLVKSRPLVFCLALIALGVIGLLGLIIVSTYVLYLLLRHWKRL